jgi:hypothetical protein
VSFGTEVEHHSRTRWGAAAVLGGLAATWYLWPAIGSGTADVLVVASTPYAGVEQPLAEAVREQGRDIIWISGPETWCDAAAVLASTDLSDVDTVALALSEVGTCEGDPIREVHARLTGEGVHGLYVALSNDLDTPSTLFETVPTAELVGDDQQLDMPCEWWNDCPASGRVTVRTTGGLTAEGDARVARMVAAAIG